MTSPIVGDDVLCVGNYVLEVSLLHSTLLKLRMSKHAESVNDFKHKTYSFKYSLFSMQLTDVIVSNALLKHVIQTKCLPTSKLVKLSIC